jgi:hypothetical protein
MADDPYAGFADRDPYSYFADVAPQPAAVNPFNRQLGADVSFGAPLQPPPTAGEQIGSAYLGGTLGQLAALKGASRGLEANLPFVDRAVAAAKANLPQGYGGTGQPYSVTLPAELAKNAAFAQQNPWTNAVAGLAASAPLAAVPGLEAGGLSAQMGKFGLLGAGAGAVQGASASPDLTNIPRTAEGAAWGGLGGAALGAAAPVGASAIGKAISPFAISPERQGLVGTLQQAGVNPTAGQITGNKTLAKLEAAASDIPFGGGGAEAAREANSRAFTQAILGKAGIEGELANPETLAKGYEALGDRFKTLSARNTLVPDARLASDLAAANSNYQSLVPASMRAPGVAGTISDLSGADAGAAQRPALVPTLKLTDGSVLYGEPGQPHYSVMEKYHDMLDSDAHMNSLNNPNIAETGFATEAGAPHMDSAEALKYVADNKNYQPPGGARRLAAEDYVPPGAAGISGDRYQATRSALTNRARSLQFTDPPQAQAYRDIRDALDSGMERSIAANNPEDAGEWAALRGQYGNYKSIEKAAGSAGAGAAEGILSPAQMRTALATGKNRGAYARGEGDLAPLTNAGNAILTNFPQSGTAARLLAARVIGGGLGGYYEGGYPGAALGVLGGTVAPAIAARTLMSRPAQSLLANQLMRGGGPVPFAVNRGALAAALAGAPQLSRAGQQFLRRENTPQ